LPRRAATRYCPAGDVDVFAAIAAEPIEPEVLGASRIAPRVHDISQRLPGDQVLPERRALELIPDVPLGYRGAVIRQEVTGGAADTAVRLGDHVGVDGCLGCG